MWSKEKYEQIVSMLSDSDSSLWSAKFRWWVKEKVTNFLTFQNSDRLMCYVFVPAKKEVKKMLFSLFYHDNMPI